MTLHIEGVAVDVHPIPHTESAHWCEVDGVWIGNYCRYGGHREPYTMRWCGGHWIAHTPDGRELGPAESNREAIAALLRERVA